MDAIKREVRDVRIPQLALIRELEEKVRKEKLSFIEFFKQRLSKSLRVADDVNEYPSWEDSLAFADEDDDWTYEDATTIPLTIDGEHVIYADPKEVLEEIVSKEGTITYEKLLEMYDENEFFSFGHCGAAGLASRVFLKGDELLGKQLCLADYAVAVCAAPVGHRPAVGKVPSSEFGCEVGGLVRIVPAVAGIHLVEAHDISIERTHYVRYGLDSAFVIFAERPHIELKEPDGIIRLAVLACGTGADCHNSGKKY